MRPQKLSWSLDSCSPLIGALANAVVLNAIPLNRFDGGMAFPLMVIWEAKLERGRGNKKLAKSKESLRQCPLLCELHHVICCLECLADRKVV